MYGSMLIKLGHSKSLLLALSKFLSLDRLTFFVGFLLQESDLWTSKLLKTAKKNMNTNLGRQ